MCVVVEPSPVPHLVHRNTSRSQDDQLARLGGLGHTDWFQMSSPPKTPRPASLSSMSGSCLMSVSSSRLWSDL